MKQAMSFREIEHKFVVGADFDKKLFATKVRSLSPTSETEVEVHDTYFVTKACPQHIFRHRIDKELHQLTIKSLEKNTENRFEVNLDLTREDQGDAVEAFLSPLSIVWRGTIEKNVCAFYFGQCEVVFYKASFAGKIIYCVEFEAVACENIEEARGVLEQFEARLGFEATARTNSTLFDLLIKPHIPKT